MDYNNGKIYRILNYIDDDCYVGSTTQPLSKRMAWHRREMNSQTKKDRLIYTKMRSVGVEHFYIELIEEFPCTNREQLLQREGHFIRELGTLNRIVAGRTKKQHYQDNKRCILGQQRQYYNEHKDVVLERNRVYREYNKDRIRQQALARVSCCCGIEYTHQNRQRHFNSQRHKELMEQQQASGDPE